MMVGGLAAGSEEGHSPGHRATVGSYGRGGVSYERGNPVEGGRYRVCVRVCVCVCVEGGRYRGQRGGARCGARAPLLPLCLPGLQGYLTHKKQGYHTHKARDYRGTSLTRKRTLLEPCSRPMPGVLRGGVRAPASRVPAKAEGRVIAGVPHLQENAPPLDPTASLCLES